MRSQPTQAQPAVPERGPNTAGPVLGIDPGLRRTGYAVLDGRGTGSPRVIEAGVIRLHASQPIEQRLVELEAGLGEIITHCRPTTLACEELYAHYRHPRTAILMAHGRGVILALAARRGLGILHIGATHVKKHLTGSGRAGKAQIQRAVAATLRLPAIPEPNDVADALAVALCGLELRRAGLLQASGGLAPAGTSTPGGPTP